MEAEASRSSEGLVAIHQTILHRNHSQHSENLGVPRAARHEDVWGSEGVERVV
jgi:hypothetical protein